MMQARRRCPAVAYEAGLLLVWCSRRLLSPCRKHHAVRDGLTSAGLVQLLTNPTTTAQPTCRHVLQTRGAEQQLYSVTPLPTPYTRFKAAAHIKPDNPTSLLAVVSSSRSDSHWRANFKNVEHSNFTDSPSTAAVVASVQLIWRCLPLSIFYSTLYV